MIKKIGTRKKIEIEIEIAAVDPKNIPAHTDVNFFTFAF